MACLVRVGFGFWASARRVHNGISRLRRGRWLLARCEGAPYSGVVCCQFSVDTQVWMEFIDFDTPGTFSVVIACWLALRFLITDFPETRAYSSSEIDFRWSAKALGQPEATVREPPLSLDTLACIATGHAIIFLC
jgi:hypothetical protein